MLSRIQKDLFDNTTSPVIKYRLALLLNEDISQECFDNFYTSKWVQMLKDKDRALRADAGSEYLLGRHDLQ